MSGVERVVEVAAPAPVVWSIVEDLSRMPELSQSTISVEGPDRLTEVGQRFAQVVRLAGKRFRSEWTLLELHPGRFLRVEGEMAGIKRLAEGHAGQQRALADRRDDTPRGAAR